MNEWFFNLRRQYLSRHHPRCGAKCRDGHACKAPAVLTPSGVPANGRCRMHGGMSPGAKTPEGKERCCQAARDGMLRYWRKKKEKQSINHPSSKDD